MGFSNHSQAYHRYQDQRVAPLRRKADQAQNRGDSREAAALRAEADRMEKANPYKNDPSD